MAQRHASSGEVFEAQRERPMTRVEVNIDCADADALRAFYCAALGYEAHGFAGSYRSCVPDGDSTGPKIVFQQVPEPKTVKNRMHLDLATADYDEAVAEAERVGARRATDVYDGDVFAVFRDPEGNEFCLLRPGWDEHRAPS
jgi:predicted enzyme related to lactoylglutathione lyase